MAESNSTYGLTIHRQNVHIVKAAAEEGKTAWSYCGLDIVEEFDNPNPVIPRCRTCHELHEAYPPERLKEP